MYAGTAQSGAVPNPRKGQQMYGFEEMTEWDYRAPTLAEAHEDWHRNNGRFAVCDLDCGASEMSGDEYDEYYAEFQPRPILCGHCKSYHSSVESIRECPARFADNTN